MAQNYDPDDVLLLVDGKIISGFADGTFIECSYDEDRYTESVGAQGEVTRNRNRNPMGQISATIKGESPDQSYLNNLAHSNRTFSVRVHKIGGERFLAGGTEGWIQVDPGKSFGDEEEDREYVFRIANYRQVDRG